MRKRKKSQLIFGHLHRSRKSELTFFLFLKINFSVSVSVSFSLLLAGTEKTNRVQPIFFHFGLFDGGGESGVPVGLSLLLFLLPCSEEKRYANEEEGVYIACCSHLQEVEAAKRKSCKK